MKRLLTPLLTIVLCLVVPLSVQAEGYRNDNVALSFSIRIGYCF